MPRPPNARRIRKLIADREKSRGLLIAFEGPDGSGKTTQRKLLKRWLESQDHECVDALASSALVKPMLKVRKKIRHLSVEDYSAAPRGDFGTASKRPILPALWSGNRPCPTATCSRRWRAMPRAASISTWLPARLLTALWPDLVSIFR